MNTNDWFTDQFKEDELIPTDTSRAAAFSSFSFGIDSQGGILPISEPTVGRFGGTGADGALVLSSGTTTIDLASAAVVVKNYKRITITGTALLNFTNPNANGSIVILKSIDSVVLNSTATPMIDCSSLGATGGAGGAAGGTGNGSSGGGGASMINNGLGGSSQINGTSGSAGTISLGTGSNTGGGGGLAGSAGTAGVSFNAQSTLGVNLKGLIVIPGSGAGGGGGGTNSAGGAGGRGGGALYIECGGAFTFVTTSGISVAGANGTGGGGGGTCGGGGGGGGGGCCVILYRRVVSKVGTITVSGGTGAGDGTCAGGGVAGGNGGAGWSLMAQNTVYI